MTPEELQAAEELLRQRPEYRWLTESGQQWYRITEIAEGLGLSRPTVRQMCERGEIPGAVTYGPDIGWRVARSGLVEYLAHLQSGQGQSHAAGE